MIITHKHVDEIFEYDGSQINPSWAFQEFGIYGSSIVTWIGPVNITPDNLKDFADVGLEIKSNYMVNFICEFFDQQPPNMRIAYLRQRLLVMIFREILAEYGVETKREGDDIFVDDRKLSISIASISLSSANKFVVIYLGNILSWFNTIIYDLKKFLQLLFRISWKISSSDDSLCNKS